MPAGSALQLQLPLPPRSGATCSTRHPWHDAWDADAWHDARHDARHDAWGWTCGAATTAAPTAATSPSAATTATPTAPASSLTSTARNIGVRAWRLTDVGATTSPNLPTNAPAPSNNDTTTNHHDDDYNRTCVFHYHRHGAVRHDNARHVFWSIYDARHVWSVNDARHVWSIHDSRCIFWWNYNSGSIWWNHHPWPDGRQHNTQRAWWIYDTGWRCSVCSSTCGIRAAQAHRWASAPSVAEVGFPPVWSRGGAMRLPLRCRGVFFLA